ncbi:VOC family protein [Streptomyces sp. NPDC093544]|jgi:catechol 2,3-dioxygenase-like lactoylglutathione lyase family enzyme|uniref:VOC family protein n=1 Tax=Streptomyces sp. NPDC093544 TaxID=3155200 RepID=UPI0034399845
MSGIRLSEVVLRTTEYDRLCDFYSLLLNQPRTVEMTPPPSDDPDEPSRICFLDFYFDPPYTQRIAVFECADVGSGPSSRGLHHFQLRTPSVEALVDLYRTLKDGGQLPVEASNHGPGTSFYYRDPDGNKVELSALNFSSRDEMRAFMATDAFKSNPNGFPLDPEQLAKGAGAGRNLSELIWER